MSDSIKFRMAARCEAAGRPNNEDNYQLDEDLSDDQWRFTADREIELGAKGALLLVCDGMGGMNAGEVASAIAVATIKQHFEADQLTDSVLKNPLGYICSSIKDADAAVKRHCKEHPETEGMGSTIVLAWLLGKKVYVGWCGDSRCYCYNPANGLVRLSHDHSYVQELVDAGKLTEELAFDHPNNNIITRSLGDPNGTARPDAKEYDLHDNDVIMLCSDGLCGCLRDNEIEEQMSAHLDSMQECRDALWSADEAAGWHDNVTIALAQILSGGAKAEPAGQTNEISDSKAELIKDNKRLKLFLILLVALVVIGGGIAAFLLLKPKKVEQEKPKEKSVAVDSVATQKPVVEDTVTVVEEKAQPQQEKNAGKKQKAKKASEQNEAQAVGTGTTQETVQAQEEHQNKPKENQPLTDENQPKKVGDKNGSGKLK